MSDVSGGGRGSGGVVARMVRRLGGRRQRAEIATLARARAEAQAAIAEAQRAHDRLREAIEILPEGIVFLDSQRRYILWNQQYASIYRRSADLFRNGARFDDTLRVGIARGDYPAAIGREDEWLAERLAMLENPQGRHEQILADGRVVLIEERRTADGGIIGLRVDITEMKQREASFRLLFDGNPVPMFVYAQDARRILAVNEAAIEHYGYPRDRLIGAPLEMIQPVADDEEAASEPGYGEGQSGSTRRHLRADGSRIDVAVFARPLPHEGVAATMIAVIDITERKRAEARIAFLAHHDALTALPNRVMLRSRMEQMIEKLTPGGPGMATLCIDLDDFKTVNDTLGHPVGDLLLQNVAERLRQETREGDLVARLGGDEFAVLRNRPESPAEIALLAERLIAAITRPYVLDGNAVAIGATIGIALAPSDGAGPDQLLKNADLALYRAKADGRGTYRFFEAEMDARVQARRLLELDLRAALQAGVLEVHYQPLVSLDSGEVTGCEALVRWFHPQRGAVPPSAFIPVAEETGLIGQLGIFVLERACRDAAQWPSHIKVAVNLSPLQFRSLNLVDVVRRALARSGLAPTRLELEITETLLLDRGGQVVTTLHALRSLGVRISMDDFGTGYSSLSYLRSFPFDKIKIDRSFIRNVHQSRDSQAIVRAIVSLGTSLGITITAEGIEEDEELARLKQEGCDEGQGFLFRAAEPQMTILALFENTSRQVA